MFLYSKIVNVSIYYLKVKLGRNYCVSQLNSLGGKEVLSRFVVVEPSELLLEAEEALRCSTEALRLFAVAASYGQACNLYTWGGPATLHFQIQWNYEYTMYSKHVIVVTDGECVHHSRDLYPVLVKRLQAGNRPCASSEAVLLLELDRIRALLVLLTQVTQTAGCHEELQRDLVRWDYTFTMWHCSKQCPNVSTIAHYINKKIYYY